MQSWSNLASLLPLTLMCYFPRNWDNLIICCSCAVCSMIGLLLIGLAKHWIIVIAGTSEITELRNEVSLLKRPDATNPLVAEVTRKLSEAFKAALAQEVKKREALELQLEMSRTAAF